MGLHQCEVRCALGARTGPRNLACRDRRVDPGNTGGGTIGGLVGCRRAVDAAAQVHRAGPTCGENHPATTAAARPVVIGRTAGIRRPGVGTGAALSVCGQAGETAGLRCDHDRSPGAATTGAVVVRRRSRSSVGGDRARAGDASGADHHDAASGTAAARVGDSAVVVCAGAAAGSCCHLCGRRRKCGPTEAAAG